jgi:hypothetical protein
MVVHTDEVDVGQIRGLVGKGGVLADQVHDVGPEPVDAAVEPEAQHLVLGGDHLGVAPVEIRLLRQEEMEVPGRRGRVPRPGRPAERRPPVVRRPVGGSVPPEVPVPAGRPARRPGVEEPGMPVAGVVRDPVEEQS